MGRAAALFVLTRLLLVAATAAPWPEECLSFETPAADDHSRKETVRPGWRRDGNDAVVRDARGRAFMADPTYPFLDAFARWDAAFYFEIAAVGYLPGENGGVRLASGFLPGYPLLLRVAAKTANLATGGRFEIPFDRPYVGLAAAFALSNALLFAALMLLHRHVLAVTGDGAAADRAAAWLCVAPTSFFFSAALSEAAFLLATLACLHAAFRRRFFAAAVCGGLAAFTRPVGLFLVLPLLVATIERRAAPRQVVKDALKALLVPAGFAAALVYQWACLKPDFAAALLEGRFADAGLPNAYFRAQALFGHGSFPTLDGIVHLVAGSGKTPVAITRDVVQATGLVVAAGLVVRLVRSARERPFFWIHVAWVLVSIAFPLLADDVVSLPRYLAAAAPLYVGAALLLPAGRRGAVLGGVSAVLQVAAFVSFARSWPVFI